MNNSITLVGVGEMGAVFAHALLRTGHPVFPALRSTPAEVAFEQNPDPVLALVTVGEDDLHPVLETVPESWRTRVALIQNELLPRDWIRHDIESPTVAVVWFEKKSGRATRVIIPTPVAGPQAGMLVEALTSIDIAAEVISDDALIDALVAKNLYILTANIAGLRTGGTVAELWDDHHPLATAVASEVLDIQDWLIGFSVDRDKATAGMVEAFRGDPNHGATGRSAPRRLERAIRHARSAGIETPVLDEIGREVGLTV
jgi:ketopantoate reductase